MSGHGRLVLFDLDGTLVDSAPDIADAVDAALTRCGRPALGEPAVRAFIGDGAARLVHRAITHASDGVAETALFERVYAEFRGAYAERLFDRSAVYPGVAPCLDELAGAGWALGCVTNKPALFTEPLLVAAALRDYFEVVLSGDSLGEKKPHAAPLLHAARLVRAAPAASVMVGDSLNDVLAARNAEMRAVCVAYGYHGGIDLAAAGADAVIESMPELPGALACLWG